MKYYYREHLLGCERIKEAWIPAGQGAARQRNIFSYRLYCDIGFCRGPHTQAMR